MKKFTLVSLVAAAAFATTAAFSASNVFAATNQDTTGKIEFNTGTDSDGKAKDITLDQAPSVDFGKQTLSSTKAQYTSTVSAPLQVTNPGVASGWTVNVQASKFLTEDDAKTELQGAVLTLNNPTAAISDGTANKSAVAKADALDFTTTGKDVVAFSADSSATGVGVNTATYKDATLTVPAGNVAGTYVAHLTWTLTNSVATSSDTTK